MKKFKLSSVVLGIAAISSTPMHAGDFSAQIANAASQAASKAGELMSAAYKGMSDKTVGVASPFIKEVSNGQVSLNSTVRNHRYEWAIDELLKAEDSEGLFQLIKTIKKHNDKHAGLAITMSVEHQAKIKRPLEEFYAERSKNLINITKKQLDELVKRWKLEYELEAIDVAEQIGDMELISKTIAFVNGNQPDDAALTKQLEAIFEIKKHYTFMAALKEVEEQKRHVAAQQILAQAQNNNNSSNNVTLRNSMSVIPNTQLNTVTTELKDSSSHIATTDKADDTALNSRKNSTASTTSPITALIVTEDTTVTTTITNSDAHDSNNLTENSVTTTTANNTTANKKKKKKKGSTNNLQQLESSSSNNKVNEDDGDDE